MHFYMVYFANYTELNLQICNYAQKRRICCIPHICHGRHGRRPCKFFLASVIFFRFNAKNWRKLAKIGVFGANLGVNGQKLAKNWQKLAFFGVNFGVNWQKLAFFGVNFIFQKFCLCKKNDKYEVCVVFITKEMLTHLKDILPLF